MEKLNNEIFLSIIVPLFNEEEKLKNIEKILSFFKREKLIFEIILVNDGSTDSTLSLVKEFVRKNSQYAKVISYKKNHGKGFTIKKGTVASKGKWILFTDIDLSVPLNEFKKFKKLLSVKKNKILIASRRVKGAKIIVHQSPFRENLGHTFTKLANSLLGLKCSDFTCGFKMFEKKLAKKIFKKQRLERWAFDAEIIFIANRLREPILEIPVRWKNCRDSKVKFPHDLLYSLFELCWIRLNHLRRVYG